MQKKTIARDSIIRVALTAGKGGSPKTERWISPPGQGALSGWNIQDMPGFIRRYGHRICMVHFKDSKDGRLVPAGQGDTDWRGVVSACLEVGVPYAFVEQETWDRDPYDCLKEAMDWLNQEITTA